MRFKNFFQRLQSLSVSQLVFLPLFLGFFLIIIWIIIRGNLEGTQFEVLIFNIILIVFGFSGIPIILRKELPSPWHTKGVPAVVRGILIVLGVWLIPILSLWKFIVNLFN